MEKKVSDTSLKPESAKSEIAKLEAKTYKAKLVGSRLWQRVDSPQRRKNRDIQNESVRA